MKISDLIKMGLRNLSRRKARTALTVIGVVIGTISIVVMVSIGLGMNKNYTSQVMELGSLTTITIQKHAAIRDDEGEYVDMKEQKLDEKLVQSVQQIKHVKAVSPVIRADVNLICGKNESYASILAMDSTKFADFDFPKLTFGQYPTEENLGVMVIGTEVMKNFYNPRARFGGGQIEIDLAKDKVYYQINPHQFERNERKKEFKEQIRNYALMEETQNWEYDGSIYMDLNYFTQMYKKYCNTLKMEERKKAMARIKEYETIKINVDSVKHVQGVQDKIKELGFQTDSLQMILKPMQETSNMLQMVLGGIGAVAMLVSAISIANTMIMSIYERTKEIGVMKVLGCVIKDIKKLFLFESAMIGLIGGLIGVGCSYAASWAINKFGGPLFQSLMQGNYMMDGSKATKFSLIPVWLPLLAVGFAMFVGILSGYYPARRATKISAIEAMKTEN